MNEETPKIEGKIKHWLSNKYNLMFLGIVILAFAIRLYFLVISKGQVPWWDSSEYLLRAKAMVLDTPITGWRTSRELVFPFMISILFRLGLGELSVRFVGILISTATVFMLYITVKEVFNNKKLGLIASALMALSWFHIFFSNRILLYAWPCLIYLVVIYFFWKGYVKDNKKFLYIFAVVASIGMQIYFSTAFVLVGILLFMLYRDGLSFLKNKNIWKALLIFILVLTPYMIYSQITFGFPIPRLVQGAEVLGHTKGAGLSGIFDYVKILPVRIGWVGLTFVGLGLLFFIIELYLRRKTLFNHESRSFDNWVLMFLCLIVPFAIYTYINIRSGFYEAFILCVFPIMFIFASNAILSISNFIKGKYNLLDSSSQVAAMLFIVVILLLFTNYNVRMTDNSIKAGINSYSGLKDAGLWLKSNTPKDSVIYSTSPPQITYFSERYTLRIPDTSEEMDNITINQTMFYVISIYERTNQQWIFSYPDEKQLNPVYVSFLDDDKTQPSIVVYELK